MSALLLPAVLVFLLFGTIATVLRRALRSWWALGAVRAAFFSALAVAVGAIALWAFALPLGNAELARRGASVYRVTLAFAAPLALTLPIAAVLVRVLSRWLLPSAPAAPAARASASLSAITEVASPEPIASDGAVAREPEPRAIVTRRRFIHMTSATLPVATLSVGAGGLVMAQAPQRLPVVRMRYPNLPPALDGLKILHLTDLHLGYFMHLPELAACLERASALAPDLIVFTGDVADDLTQLGEALALAAAQKPRYGAFACIGNHELFRGLGRVRRIFDASPVPLLLERGVTVPIGDARLHVSGSHDPQTLGGDVRPFLRASVERALDGAPSDAFHLLLSHRPQGFDPAADLGVELTLAGHTHGAQLGHKGRSLVEPLLPGRYLWGDYQRGSSRLYTSAGFGHWFPVRLDCPTEAPLIVLERG